MSTTKQIALDYTYQQEKGWYPGDQEFDPNPTMDGVTQSTYTRLGYTGSVKDMTPAQREAIYEVYWQESEADLFGPLTAPLIFDHAYNAGPLAARKMVQRALDVTADGIFGSKTKAAIAKADDAMLAFTVLAERLVSYDEISDDKKKRTALKAWVGRLVDYYKVYLRPLSIG